MKVIPVKRNTIIIATMIVVLIVATIISIRLGRYDMTLSELVTTLFSPITGAEVDPVLEKVIFRTRLPRIIVGILVGCGLSIAGATYQGTFRNPMVSPDLLGASAGAAFGAVIGLMFDMGHVGVQIIAFAISLIAVFLSYGISRAITKSGDNILSLVLTGMVISSLFQAFISMVKFTADPNSKLPQITYWLLGSISGTLNSDILVLLIPVLIGTIPLMLMRWRLNTLSFGDEEARALGINPQRMRLIVIICSTLITAACVAVSGMIGWVGLIIPHLARMTVGPNYKDLLPASALLGGIFLLIVDNIARCFASTELPLSVLTAVIGAPFFLYLLFRGRKSWL